MLTATMPQTHDVHTDLAAHDDLHDFAAARADEQFQLGHDAGVDWATHTAKSDQLDRLASLADELGDEAASYFVNVDKAPHRSCDVFADTVDPALAGDSVGRRRLWKSIATDVNQARIWTNPNFVAGVFDGAVAAWRELRTEL